MLVLSSETQSSMFAFHPLGYPKPSLLIFFQGTQGPLNKVALIRSRMELIETLGEEKCLGLNTTHNLLMSSSDALYVLRFDGTYLDAIRAVEYRDYPYKSCLMDHAAEVEEYLSTLPYKEM